VIGEYICIIVTKSRTPKNAKGIKQFLGLAGYYRRFVPNFSGLAKPLTSLLKKNVPFVWKPEQQKAFETLRIALCQQSILQYPDFSKPFVLTTDASDIGGVLSQDTIGQDLPIAYVSRVLNSAEKFTQLLRRNYWPSYIAHIISDHTCTGINSSLSLIINHSFGSTKSKIPPQGL